MFILACLTTIYAVDCLLSSFEQSSCYLALFQSLVEVCHWGFLSLYLLCYSFCQSQSLPCEDKTMIYSRGSLNMILFFSTYKNGYATYNHQGTLVNLLSRLHKPRLCDFSYRRWQISTIQAHPTAEYHLCKKRPEQERKKFHSSLKSKQIYYFTFPAATFKICLEC